MYSRKYLFVIALVMVVGIGLFLLLRNRTETTAPALNHNVPAKEFTVDKKDISAAVVPKGFPEKLVTESGAKILQNYEATASDGRIQSTRVITTSKPLADAVSSYQKFFEDDMWLSVSTTKPDTNTITIVMRKNDSILLIVGKNDASTLERTVELTLTEPAQSINK